MGNIYRVLFDSSLEDKGITRTKINMKLKLVKFKLERCDSFFLTVKVMNHSNKLPREKWDFSSLDGVQIKIRCFWGRYAIAKIHGLSIEGTFNGDHTRYSNNPSGLKISKST